MLDKLNSLKQGKNSVYDFCDSIRQGIPLAVFGVAESFKCFLSAQLESQVVLVCTDGLLAKKYLEEISQLTSKKAIFIPPKEQNLIATKAFSKDLTYSRLCALSEIGKADIIVTTIDALYQPFPKQMEEVFLSLGDSVSPTDIVNGLIRLGYKRVDALDSKGSFSLRGDILDIFAINHENPVRIDFFGDEVESIKFIDIESRKNLQTLKQISVIQCSEFVFNKEEINLFKQEVRKEISSAKGKAKDRLLEISDDFYLACETLDQDYLQAFASISQKVGDLFGLLLDDAVIIFDEAKRSYDYSKLVIQEFTERFNALITEGEVFSFIQNNLYSEEYITQKLKGFRLCALQALSTAIPYFNPLKIINPEVSGIINYQVDFEEVFKDIDNWLSGGYTLLICTGENKRSNTLNFELSTRGIASSVNGNYLKGVCITDNSLNNGFIFHEEKLVVIGSGNLYKKPVLKKTKSAKSSFFTAPEAGDYCVHEVHGIGKALGCNRISTTEGTKDYITIEYSGGDILYIPVEQLDVLTRYLGAEKKPKLSKIGGADFEKVKRAVKESIKKMSFDLKKLYAERSAKQGFCFNVYQDLEKEFASDFEFEETPDQLACDNDIKRDMNSNAVMDRLVCGDVGFGKTEVAFKAIFRAVANGKQAVLLAPTTILAEQHYTTAKKRFARFGIKIACLNRFRTAKQVERILLDLEAGEIDFIIGTHRLLSKDVKFSDLGLLVLDEEQRFGVEHKEKIKLLRNNIDTLTLSATPIPRTLHMSLSGIREISVIQTPPKKRLPVQIFVTEETEAMIKDAVTKEINRGGQVFILYNRVETINAFAKRLTDLMPGIKLTVAHGRLEEKVLENKIVDFYNGVYDVLVSTTIIENGIDLPKANTLIVIDADKLGLSSLYQLKGRVGRSDRLAYAYFTFKRDKVLSSVAYERLNTIIEFTEMGSGIKVAMRDLEIRGAGNILGAEQHGHMDKIGYELYSKLLREEMTGEEEVIPEIDLRISAYIPESYIESNSSRMSVYKEIAEITHPSDSIEIIQYLTETYGKIPKETLNLLQISVIKRLAMKIFATKLVISKSQTAIEFADFKPFKDKKLMQAIEENKHFVRISMAEKPCLEFDRIKETNEQMLEEVKKFLQSATN